MSEINLDGTPCPLCNVGTLSEGTYTNTFEQDGALVVVRGIPGWVCDSCGEGYSTGETTDRLLDLVDEAIVRGTEVDVMRYSHASAKAA